MSIHGNKKRKKQQGDGVEGTNKKFMQGEAQKSADILQRVINGSSSKERERDVKKGKFARGETAYDYEFDDGLGAGSFRKKKVRAFVGSALHDFSVWFLLRCRSSYFLCLVRVRVALSTT